MKEKECYAILELKDGSDLADVKRAYRRLAFALHPDLNPDVLDASRRFQRLNEAYVTLSQALSGKGRGGRGSRQSSAGQEEDGPAGAKAREEAYKAYAKAKADEARAGAAGPRARSKEDVLNDILNDPFARRVFEDIYSHIRHEGSDARKKEAPRPRPAPAAASRAAPAKKPDTPSKAGALVGKVKDWLRRQIDDEQVIRLPGESLVPGARVRLEIQHGLGGESQTIELTLPPSFEPGKAMRLRGLGKRVAGWQGDLYVRLVPL